MANLRNVNLPVRGISLSLKDIEKIYERLSALVVQQGARDAALWRKPPDESQEQFEKRTADLKLAAYRVDISIKGSMGPKGNYAAEIQGTGADIFTSPNLPESIDAVYLTNTTAYAASAGGRFPDSSFKLFFDFSKPPLIDGSNAPSAPTRNFSLLEISGSSDWVSAIKDAVEQTTKNRKNKRYSLHAPMIYDAGLMVLAVPVALYLCWRLSGAVHGLFGSLSPFLVAATYIYIMFGCLWIYRAIFGYAKWAFPIVELTDTSNASRHRKFLLAILTIIILPIGRDILTNFIV